MGDKEDKSNKISTETAGDADFGGRSNPDFGRLRDKYRAERSKRLRTDGQQQYVAASGRFAHLLDDPYTVPDPDRTPVSEKVDVIIIGGGFGGLLSAARLIEAGIEDFRIVERAGDFGGTWYWNRYPGAACDTESYVYMPLLEETGYMPTSKYAKGPELFEHSRRIGRHFDLYRRTLFQTNVSAVRWDAAARLWRVTTDRGDTIAARFAIVAGGNTLGRPKLPGVPGIEAFEGHCFHTSRWDYAYTGGDATGGLAGLADKRVGIIGTGATGVQCIPHLGRSARELHVFQRTPSSVDVRNDRPTNADWADSLMPGWHQERIANFTSICAGEPVDVDLVDDAWTQLIAEVIMAAQRRSEDGDAPADPRVLVQQADFRKMEQVRARIDAIVADPATAEALKPWYSQFCKRPCFSDDYLPIFNRPNVHLVDTGGAGVREITATGVVVGDTHYDLDCLVFATGFEVGGDYNRNTGFEIYGEAGLTLTEKWKDGAQTLHGLMIRGFPNLFISSTRQSGQSPNFQHTLDQKARHVAHIIAAARSRAIAVLQPSAEAERAWVDTVVAHAEARYPYLSECTPGYYNNEGGALDTKFARDSQYWRGPTHYIELLESWRAGGDFPGLEAT